MREHELGAMEQRFAEIIWAREPVQSGELVRICAQELGWKKSTNYTMLRRLCERGLFKNEGGTVSALMSKGELAALQSERFIEENFGGSLPGFLAAFTSRHALSDSERAELQRLIDESRG